MKSWEQRERARAHPLERNRLRQKAARRSPARRAGVPQHLLGRDVEPRLPDGLPPVQRRRRHRLRARSSCRRSRSSRSCRDAGRRCVTLESQTPVGDFDVVAFSVSFEWDYVNVLTLLRLAGIPRYAAERTQRHPLIVIGGAVTFVNPEPLALFADVIAAGEGEVLVPGLRARVPRGDRPRRPAAPACARARFLRPVVLRAAVRRRRHADRLRRCEPGVDAPLPVRKAALKTTEAVDPPATEHLHARHRVRLALPRRSRARLREPLPLLLGRLQLPAGPRVSDRPHPAARRGGAGAFEPRRAWCRSRSAITRTSSGSWRACSRWATRSAPRRCGSTISREPIVRILHAERRAHDHDRAGDRVGSAAPRHQQDRHERRDPRSRRADLRQRHREPEALLHDRPPDRNRRGPRGDPRPDAADPRPHDEARARPRARSAGSSAA